MNENSQPQRRGQLGEPGPHGRALERLALASWNARSLGWASAARLIEDIEDEAKTRDILGLSYVLLQEVAMQTSGDDAPPRSPGLTWLQNSKHSHNTAIAFRCVCGRNTSSRSRAMSVGWRWQSDYRRGLPRFGQSSHAHLVGMRGDLGGGAAGVAHHFGQVEAQSHDGGLRYRRRLELAPRPRKPQLPPQRGLGGVHRGVGLVRGFEAESANG